MCPYKSNPFCKQLNEKTRLKLCECCHLRNYAKKQQFFLQDWNNVIALLVDGLVVVGSSTPIYHGRFVHSCPTVPGDWMNIAKIMKNAQPNCKKIEMSESTEVICVTECKMALFTESHLKELFDSEISFVQTLMYACMRSCANEKVSIRQAINCQDAYTSVKAVINYCRKYGFYQLTHEQIALLSNRSRPTVTEIMHILLKEEPELFQVQPSL